MFEFLKKNKLPSVKVNDLDSLIGKIKLIDIREPSEVAHGTIKSAKNIPMGNLLSNTNKYLDKETTYYIMCQSGARSGRTTRSLAKQGYHVVNVLGGMGSYSGAKRK